MVYLVNQDMRLVPQGEIGELLVAGRNLAAGYLRDRESHRFMDNPYAIDPGWFFPSIFEYVFFFLYLCKASQNFLILLIIKNQLLFYSQSVKLQA